MADAGTQLGYLEAAIYGLIQGLTEFLPVSSSGHLAIAHRFGLGALDPGLELPFDVLLHAATLVAIVIAFRHDLLLLLRAWRPRWYGLILLAAVPTGLFGLLGGDLITGMRETLWAIALCYLGTALLLFASERIALRRLGRGEEGIGSFDELTVRQALFVGLMQIPTPAAGVSRSGATVAGGLVAGLQPDFAVRFSFLIGLPLIAGAAAKDALDGGFAQLHAKVGVGPLAVAFLAAVLSGLVAAALLRLLARRRRLSWFGAYCLVLAVVLLGLEVLW